MRFEAATTIDSPASAIWSYAADIGRHPEWMTVTDARVLRGTGAEVGSRGRARSAFGPIKLDTEFEISEAEPGRRIVWRTVDDPRFDWDVTLELDPIDASRTNAVYRASIELHGRWRLASPLVAMEGRGGVTRELGKLKDKAEASARPVLADAGR